MICRDNGWMTLGQLDPSEDLIFILKDTLNISRLLKSCRTGFLRWKRRVNRREDHRSAEIEDGD